jgi:predicted RNA-binding Zn-ribbon protein involved in translation (DUF1610 family)
MKMHSSITMDRVIEMVRRYNTSLDNPGACLACGAEAMGVEPDATKYECESCGEPEVYGASELLFMI